MKYAVVENQTVVNVVVSDPAFAQSQGWIEIFNNAGIGWSYIDGQFIEPPPKPLPIPEQIAFNKQQAELLLQQTDWTATVDINNPEYSNPYLGNQHEFLAYRSAIRQIAITPPETPIIDWPVKPDEVWVSI